MEIALLGGTGALGRGLALRWGRDADHDLVIGSRDGERASDAATDYRERLAARGVDAADSRTGASGGVSITGAANDAAVEGADVVVAAVPPAHLASTVAAVADSLCDDAVLVSPASGLDFGSDGVRPEPPDAGSYAAVAAAAAPPDVPVVGAFHTLAADLLADLDRAIDLDALVVGDDADARATVADLAETVDGLRALDAGPLANAGAVESLTALQITVGLCNDLRDVGVRFR